MNVHLVLTMLGLIAGQQEKAPKAGAETVQAPVQVHFLGREDFTPKDGRGALALRIDRGGNVISKWVIVTDEMLEKWVNEHCKGHDKASIVIGVTDPSETSIRALERAIEKVTKYVPKKTKVTVWIKDIE